VLPAEGDLWLAGISDGMLGAVDEEVRRIVDECYAETRRVLGAHLCACASNIRSLRDELLIVSGVRRL
jgi:hypothetical protein